MPDAPNRLGSLYPAAVRTVAGASAMPYGYTITVWSSGAVIMHAHGTPNVGDVFLFLAGALAGFGAVALAGRAPSAPPLEVTRGDLASAGTLHAGAVGAAVGAAALLAPLHGPAAWLLGSLAATVLYLVVAAFELALVHRLRSRRRDSPAPVRRRERKPVSRPPSSDTV